MHKGFKAYTNDPDGTINNFYHWLFAHQIDFAFNPDKEHKQMKEEMQRKIAHNKYEASSPLTTLALSTEYKMHVEEEEEEKEGGEAVAKAASLLMALAFTINNGPKVLICWRFNKCINCLIVFKPSGQILYMRCTVYWCLRTITYFDEAYSFIKRQYPPCPILLF
ncbi:uncharacterized protein ACA1_066940 [Acanthamoeba castellanii str. Neff]|uniref:Uncharacterized protein n=1 Tax=Acanthamoeba castellanii (strain ATCC 30010 / Neff) TaxID=1257118 RepID=L8GPU0_ACACF|nr:uncharacterized protein ACA1_066940 [Acanthamoeba castellanii str. Neff]ELR14653.1 hypothetical protein ACA1_066940 [Acanthamoeba castellanii str. Neff]